VSLFELTHSYNPIQRGYINHCCSDWYNLLLSD